MRASRPSQAQKANIPRQGPPALSPLSVAELTTPRCPPGRGGNSPGVTGTRVSTPGPFKTSCTRHDERDSSFIASAVLHVLRAYCCLQGCQGMAWDDFFSRFLIDKDGWVGVGGFGMKVGGIVGRFELID